MSRNRDIASEILASQEAFLNYCKNTLPVFHQSNIFLRDLQYAVIRFMELRGITVGMSEGESAAITIAEKLRLTGVFKQIDTAAWTVNFPAFATSAPRTYDAKETV